jgi:hypothetical protein
VGSVKFIAAEVGQSSAGLEVASKLVVEGWRVHAIVAWALAKVDLFVMVVV